MVQRLDEDTFVSVDPEQDTASDDRGHYTHACAGYDGNPGPEIAWCGAWFVSRGRVYFGRPKDGCPDCEVSYVRGDPCPRGCGWSKW